MIEKQHNRTAASFLTWRQRLEQAAEPHLKDELQNFLQMLETVGNTSCTRDSACTTNSGQIGNGSCNGDYACFNNTLNIGSGRCNVSPEKLPCHSPNP
jgi:hypothetical protein